MSSMIYNMIYNLQLISRKVVLADGSLLCYDYYSSKIDPCVYSSNINCHLPHVTSTWMATSRPLQRTLFA